MTTQIRLLGGVAGAKTVSLGDFDAWMDAQMRGRGDTSEVYRSVAWAFRCVNLRANAVSAMPFTVTPVGADEPVDSPWPLTRLLWHTEAALCTWGAAYWLKRTNRVVIKDLQWLNPTTMHVERGENGIEYFEQRAGGIPKRFQPSQIVYFKLWNPNDDLGPGIAPLDVALDAAGIARGVNKWASAFFEHGAIPTILLHTDAMLPRGEAERIETAWSRMVGGVANAWKAIVTQGGLKPEVITPPVNTLALPELSAGVRGQIATALGVPQTMLEDAANYATAVEHKKSFIKDTVTPECLLISEVINEQLLAALNLELQFQPEELDELQADESDRAASLKQLVDAGMPLKLALEILGYDLTDEQWTLVEQAEIEKQQAQEREFELQKERFAQPPAAPTNGRPAKSDAADAMRSDLRLWEKKAVKRIRERGAATCDFTSDAIPPAVKADVLAGLVQCQNVEDVKALFDIVVVGDAPPQEVPLDLENLTGERLHEYQLRGLEDALETKLRQHFQDVARQVAATVA